MPCIARLVEDRCKKSKYRSNAVSKRLVPTVRRLAAPHHVPYPKALPPARTEDRATVPRARTCAGPQRPIFAAAKPRTRAARR